VLSDYITGLSISDGIIYLTADAAEEFAYVNVLKLELIGSNIAHYVTLKRYSNTPSVANSLAVFDKNALTTADYSINLRGNELVAVTGNGITEADYIFANGVLSLYPEYLLKLANGRYSFAIETSVNTIDVYADVTGTVDLFTLGQGTKADPYRIFAQEQLVNLSAGAAINNYYNGKYFLLTNDIDLRGIAFNAIAKFSGTLDGGNYKIYNFNIVNAQEGSIGFIAANYGTVKNLTLEANLDINVKEINAGLVAGVNYGTIDNVIVNGSVSVKYKTGVTNHSRLYVGGAVGVNYGTVNTVVVRGSVYVKSEGVSISSTVYAAGIIGINEGTAEGLVAENTLTNETVKWHSSKTNAIANSK
jgi:hypothetical protein